MTNNILDQKEAKVVYHPVTFEVVEDGDYVICAVTGHRILLIDLLYWSVEFQEPYKSHLEALKVYEERGRI